MKTGKNIRLLAAICAMTALIGSESALAEAVNVTAERLNVRSSASADSKSVTLVREGDMLEYICEADDWIKVACGSKTGYVMKTYVSIDEDLISADVAANLNTYSTPRTATATARVNMRALPLTGSDALKVIGKNDAVTVVGECGDWYRVTYSGKTGFVMSEFLSMGAGESETAPSNTNSGSNSDTPVTYAAPIAATVNARVNLRASATTGSKVVKVLANKASVSITGDVGDWYQVSASGKTGYIKKEFVSPAGQAGGSAESSEVSYTSPVNAKATTKVNLRSSASTSGSILTVIGKNETVTVLGELGDWYKVSDGQKSGYAAKEYLDFTGGSSNAPASPSSSASSNTINVTNWTGVADVEINMRKEPEGDVLYVLKSGTEFTVTGENGSWYQVSYRDSTGFVAKAYVSEKKAEAPSNNATKGTTAYVTVSSVNVRSGAGTNHGVVTTLRYGAELTIYELTDGWYRMESGSDSGYISSKYVSTTKPAAAPSNPSSNGSKIGKVVESDWWTGDIQDVFKRGYTATITDVDTGLSFEAKRTGGNNHADAQPLTASDTAIMLEAYGGSWSWNRRAIWVTINGTTYAASMNGMPHGSTDSMPDNNFDGCFCIHFTNSRTHAGNRLDAAHQSAIKKALNAAS